MMPFMRVASEADKARIDPSTGPIQGVQPKAKLARKPTLEYVSGKTS